MLGQNDRLAVTLSFSFFRFACCASFLNSTRTLGPPPQPLLASTAGGTTAAASRAYLDTIDDEKADRRATEGLEGLSIGCDGNTWYILLHRSYVATTS